MAMSQYVFHCHDCNMDFTRILHVSEREKNQIVCPYCGSRRVEQKMTDFSAVTDKKS
jgi:putative FmdB family regulatory protein